MIIRLGIVGSRQRNEKSDYEVVLDFVCHLLQKDELHLVSGGCNKGADRFAEDVARQIGLPITIWFPDRRNLPESPERRHFRVINYERNGQIAEDCDCLLALVADNRKGGTEDTVRKTYLLNKEVYLR